MTEEHDYEDIDIYDTYEECHDRYGRTDFYMTDKDIELLKQGKIICCSVEREYSITLAYKGE